MCELHLVFALTLQRKMLIPKKQRQAIYMGLFNDGVMVAHKDFNAPKHTEIETRNLYVIKSMQVESLIIS